MKPVYKRRIQKLIEFIQSYPEHYFDMSSFVDNAYTPAQSKKPEWNRHPCGTAGCIAGFAAMKVKRVDPKGTPVERAERIVESGWGGADDIAMEWMGISPEVATVLFIPTSHRFSLEDVKRKHAVAILKRLMKNNGDLTMDDWYKVMKV
jgi:hypothetical protein